MSVLLPTDGNPIKPLDTLADHVQSNWFEYLKRGKNIHTGNTSTRNIETSCEQSHQPYYPQCISFFFFFIPVWVSKHTSTSTTSAARSEQFTLELRKLSFQLTYIPLSDPRHTLVDGCSRSYPNETRWLYSFGFWPSM